MSFVESLDEALRSTTIESEQGQISREKSGSTSAIPSEASTASSHDISKPTYRPASLITVHRKQYLPSMSETSSDEDSYDIDNSPPSPSAPHAVVIGNYVNVGTLHLYYLRACILLKYAFEGQKNVFSDLSFSCSQFCASKVIKTGWHCVKSGKSDL